MNRGRVFRIGGVVSGIVLIVFGVVTIVLAVWGQHTVTSELKKQKITGTPDMTPSAIKSEVQKAGLTNISLPTCNVANKPINDGSRAKCFAQYMNVHALEATGGFVYAEMGQYEAKPDTPKDQLAPGGGTNNPDFAVTDPKTKGPASNGARNVWVTQTALATALNVSFMASALSLFSLIVGIALLLTGIGFIILALGLSSSASEKPAERAAPVPAQ
jgi:Ca2+/Na+ antiporter